MFWIPAMSHRVLRTNVPDAQVSDLRVLRVSAPQKAQGIVGFVEQRASPLSPGVFTLFNPAPTASAFLVARGSRPVEFQLLGETRRVPKGAWEDAWRDFWALRGKLTAPSSAWFDYRFDHPSRLAFLASTQGLAQLHQRYPNSHALVTQLDALERLRLESQLRPVSTYRPSVEVICDHQDPCSFEDPAHPFPTLRTQAPRDLELAGPATYEIRAVRKTSDPALQPLPSRIDVTSTYHRLGELEVRSWTNIERPPPLSRIRVFLPEGMHAVRLRLEGAPTQVSVRKLNPRERVSARVKGASRVQVRVKIKSAAAQLRDTALTQALLQHVARLDPRARPFAPDLPSHDDLCQRGLPWLCARDALLLSRDLRVHAGEVAPRLQRACAGLSANTPTSTENRTAKQWLLAQLSHALLRIGQEKSAHRCLGEESTILNEAYLQTALDRMPASSPGTQDRWLLAAHAWLAHRPASGALRRAFWRRWKRYARPNQIAPARSAHRSRLRWLEPSTAPQSKLGPSLHHWYALSPNRRYTTRTHKNPAHAPTTLRLALSLGPRKERKGPGELQATALIQIGKERHHVSITREPQIFTWIVSPDAHAIQIHGADEIIAHSDQPIVYSEDSVVEHYAERSLWPTTTENGPTHFQLPEQRGALPIVLRARVAVSDKAEHRRTLPLLLRSDHQDPRRIWLHYDPQTVDPSLHFGEFGTASFPLDLHLASPVPGAKLWITKAPKTPAVAVGLQTRTVRTRSERSAGSGDVLPWPNEPIYAAQGPERVDQRIQRALRLYQDQRWGELRSELEAVLTWPSKKLAKHRSALHYLLHGLSSHTRQTQFHFQDNAGANPRRALRAPFLDPQTQDHLPTPRETQHAIAKAAQSLQETKFSSISRALQAISDFMRQPSRDPAQVPLIYGMLKRISEHLDGSLIAAWKRELNHTTHWQSIQYASQSAGHAMLRAPAWDAQSSTIEAFQALAPPWSDPARTLHLRPSHDKTLNFERSKSSIIRAQVYCTSRRPESSIPPMRLEIRNNRHTLQRVELRHKTLTQLDFRLHTGKQRVVFHLDGDTSQYCGLRLLEQRESKAKFLPLDLTRAQRWFLATAQKNVEFRAQGPGTVRIDVRHLRATGLRRQFILTTQSPTGRRFEQRLELGSHEDPAITLEQAPNHKVSTPTSHLALMPERGVYRFTLQTSSPQLLAKASTRQGATASTRPVSTGGFVQALAKRLVLEPSSLLTVPPRAYRWPSELQKVSSISELPLRQGIWSAQGAAGIEADAEFEEPKPRWTTRGQAQWMGALIPHRLWAEGTFQISSEDRIRPAGSLQAKIYTSSRSRLWWAQFALRGIAQPLNRWAHAYDTYGRFAFSVGKLFVPNPAWDLRPAFYLGYKGMSQATRDIQASRFSPGLHTSIYRSYTRDHPFSARPGFELVWRRFYDLRAVLGHDLWLNANLASLDRMRGWASVNGLLDPFRRWNRVQWAYKAKYRATFALRDEHRNKSWLRQEIALGLWAAWRSRQHLRWELSVQNTLLFKSQSSPANRFMLGASLCFDRAGALYHRPPKTRKFPQELEGARWTQRKETPRAVQASR